jgi:hypothetical protein
MKRLLLLIALLVTGCGVNPTPTPTASETVIAMTDNGNPDTPVCGPNLQQNCLLNKTITDTTTGKIIATIPISQMQYTVDSTALDTYSVVVNVQVVPGQILPGIPATATASK